MCLLLIGVFLANSRATILALVFGLLQFDYIRKPKTLLIAFSIFLIMVLPFSDYILNVYHSIFDFTGNYDVGGSSMDMRMRQLDISLFLFLQKPYIWWWLEYDLLFNDRYINPGTCRCGVSIILFVD